MLANKRDANHGAPKGRAISLRVICLMKDQAREPARHLSGRQEASNVRSLLARVPGLSLALVSPN